jgi:hypothetical protein
MNRYYDGTTFAFAQAAHADFDFLMAGIRMVDRFVYRARFL